MCLFYQTKVEYSSVETTENIRKYVKEKLKIEQGPSITEVTNGLSALLVKSGRPGLGKACIL